MGKLTKEDLAACHMRELMHLNGGKDWFGYVYQCVEHPRLSRKDTYTRKEKSVQSVWHVDGSECSDIDAALAALALPVVLTDEERAALVRWRDDFDTAWRSRVANYAMMRALSDKGLLDGRKGITETGLAALQPGAPK